jgi:hypothetical protein
MGRLLPPVGSHPSQSATSSQMEETKRWTSKLGRSDRTLKIADWAWPSGKPAREQAADSRRGFDPRVPHVASKEGRGQMPYFYKKNRTLKNGVSNKNSYISRCFFPAVLLFDHEEFYLFLFCNSGFLYGDPKIS